MQVVLYQPASYIFLEHHFVEKRSDMGWCRIQAWNYYIAQVGELKKLVEEGKVKHLGLSEGLWDLLCTQSASYYCCANGVVPLDPGFGRGHSSYLQVIKQFMPVMTIANQLLVEINSMSHDRNEHLENTYSICNSRTKFTTTFVQSATVPLLDSQLPRQKRKRKKERSCWRIICISVCVCVCVCVCTCVESWG